MNRTEFLEQLEEALQGEVSPAKLDENLRYYDTYIQTQVRLGRTEEEVLQQLGDPRLIARTIIDVDGQGGWGESSGPYASYSSENCRKAEPSGSRARRVNTDAWYTRLGCLAAGILTIVILFVILKSVVKLTMYLAVPLLVIFLVLWVVKQFRER